MNGWSVDVVSVASDNGASRDGGASHERGCAGHEILRDPTIGFFDRGDRYQRVLIITGRDAEIRGQPPVSEHHLRWGVEDVEYHLRGSANREHRVR